MKKIILTTIILTGLFCFPLTLLADDNVVANQIDLMNRVNDLQQQVQTLQGQVEELSHTVQSQQTQTASQYSDIDQRLRKLEGQSSTSPPASSPAPMTDLSQNKETPETADNNKGASENTQADSNDKQAYEAAYEEVKNNHYAKAIHSLQNFLTQYPKSTYVPHAHYWLGQMYLLKGNGTQAATEFSTVLKQYPQHEKAKDAALKLGFAYLLQNKNAQAKAQFKKVIQQYPGSSTAQIAETRLAQMP